jgi:hypothetical protein
MSTAAVFVPGFAASRLHHSPAEVAGPVVHRRQALRIAAPGYKYITPDGVILYFRKFPLPSESGQNAMNNFKRVNKILQILQIVLLFVLIFMLFRGFKIIFPLLMGGGK